MNQQQKEDKPIDIWEAVQKGKIDAVREFLDNGWDVKQKMEEL